ncbi:unnamed protein product [Soboliphyme baturini]|uniref:Thioredoxin domain-containing protein n=1 Tax=Soboliphyme baturini TaxID=241478 RepID=A0A183ISC4_9BILA|nr:unnamed protein product [Soboliphyme baturini]
MFDLFRIYEQTVLPGSYVRPYLIFVYAEWCIACRQAEPAWVRIVNDFQPIGFGIATVNSMIEGTLAERLRARRLPMLVSVVDGRVFRSDGSLGIKDVLRFVRTVFPSGIMILIEDLNEFHKVHADAVRRNKVLVVIFSDQEKPRMRYLVSALNYRPYCQFAFVNTQLAYGGLVEEFQPADRATTDTLMIFNEVMTVPAFRVELSASEFESSSFADAIQARKLLLLPRLSSQNHFDSVCPPNAMTGIATRRWCAILVVSLKSDDDLYISQYRLHSTQLSYGGSSGLPAVRPCYVYQDVQTSFVDVLFCNGTSETDAPASNDGQFDPHQGRGDMFRTIVLLLRLNKDTAKYLTLRNVWNGTDAGAVNRSLALVRFYLQQLNGDDSQMTMLSEAHLPTLVDENAPTLYRKLAARFMRGLESFSYQLTKEEVLPIVSVLGTLGAICLMGYLMNYVSNVNDNPLSTPPKSKSFKKAEELSRLIRELRAETYFGMVRLLKPGCRTIVLLCDKESKDVLLPQFGQIIWPWRSAMNVMFIVLYRFVIMMPVHFRNKTLMFGYVMLEKNLSWFRNLLELTLPDPNLVNINARNVTGTVLSLNGFRQYFCVYHPKYASSMAGYGKRKSKSDHLYSVGFNSDYGDSTDDERREKQLLRDIQKKKVLRTDELLDGLSNWLDRLFEGSVKRFYIAQWPSIR